MGLENFWNEEGGWQTRRKKNLGIWYAIVTLTRETLNATRRKLQLPKIFGQKNTLVIRLGIPPEITHLPILLGRPYRAKGILS
jgi:hypothetical protein